MRADELSFELARAMLEAVGPDELPLLDALGVDFVQAASAGSSGDGALGFDVSQLSMALVAGSVAAISTDQIVEMTIKQGADGVKELVKYLKRRRSESGSKNNGDDTAVVLAANEITEVRKHAYQHACGLGLSKSKANLLADALAGSLT